MKDEVSAAVSPADDAKPQDQAAAGAQLFSKLLIVSFVLVFSLVALGTIRQESPTIDEPIHLLAGYSYLKWGDYRVNPEHPPLTKILAALPLLALDVKDPRPTAPEWDQIPKEVPGVPTAKVAAEMFFVQNDAETLFRYGKMPFLFLALLLGLFVFLWAEEWFGPVAAAAALVLFATDPNIIAHSTLVHTDMAFTTFFFVGTYFFQRTLRSGSWLNGWVTCILFGMAAITKFSAVGIFITWALIGVVWLFNGEFRPRGDAARVFTRSRKFMLMATIFVGMTFTAFGLIWAAYGFRFHAIPGGGAQWSYAHVMPPNPSALLQRLVSLATQFRLLPDAWIYGQLYNVTYLRRTAFLLGDFSDNGFWLYFPVALLAKTPVPALLLIALAIINLFTLRKSAKIERCVLWIPIVVYFTLAVWARMNIGVRHVLP
ncbi:MAG TPA: glycosyltransferase family 39 protein, partial [Methylomirabilota bacterium]|nr:glycosyltransferase family 39 protein [Methylomirabilota bacterium]